MDESTNYYYNYGDYAQWSLHNYNYTQGSTPLPNDQMMGCIQPVTVPSVLPQRMDVSALIPVHRKIHINPSVLMSQHRRENFLATPLNSSHSSSPHTESRSPVKRKRNKNRNRHSRSSKNFRRHKRATDIRNINNNGSKISSRELANLILGIRAEQHRTIRNDNDDVDVDELMNRELSNREKVKRTVDARLWLQAKTALNKSQHIVEARNQKRENYESIRLEIVNKTFVNRGTSPIIFESVCENELVGECQIANVKTEVKLLESDDDECQIVEIDSKIKDELLRDDADDYVVSRSRHVD